MTLSTAVGHIIAQRRAACGRKQSDLARCAGVSRYMLCRFETGCSKINLEQLESLAAALKISVNQLIYLAELARPVPVRNLSCI